MKRLYLITLIVCLAGCSEKTPVNIDEPDITLSFPENEITIKRGGSRQLQLDIKGELPQNATIEWVSANQEIVSVDDNGLVTGLQTTRNRNDQREYDIYVTAYLSTHPHLAAKCKVNVDEAYLYRYRLYLKDKGEGLSVGDAARYLSEKALLRRNRQNIPLDYSDLPISDEYISRLENLGGKIVSKSKWLQTVCVEFDDMDMLEGYMALPFVVNSVMVQSKTKDYVSESSRQGVETSSPKTRSEPEDYYGLSYEYISAHKGNALHDRNFKGAGMDIALIDGGFPGVGSNPYFSNTVIKGSKSFIPEYPDFTYDNKSHGIWTLSCMGANRPGGSMGYVGTAPEANYWLLSTEKEDDEFPVEEDYLVEAMEYADSAGADLINISLYYITFDMPEMNHKYEDLNGKTAFATRGANVAASKGIFTVCCAGNDGYWVGSPADSPNVLTVGNVFSNGQIGHFTAFGMTVDGRMKPDVVAVGAVYVVSADLETEIEARSGTSYSSPIMCGLAACLWQAYPDLTNTQLLEIMKKAGDRSDSPELPYGHGMPDMEKAMQLAESIQ